MTGSRKTNPSNRILLVFTVLCLLTGCGKKREQNSFTTPEREFSGSIGLANTLIQSHEAYAEAKAAMDKEDWDAAATVLQALLDGPDPQAAFANDLSIVEIRRDNLQAALKACKLAISLDPQYDRAYFNKGTILSQLDRQKEAIKAYKSAVSLNDYYYEAWYNLGLLHYRKENLEASKEAFLKITERTRSSRFNNAYYQLGLIAADQGDDPQAVKFYSESLLLDPSHVPSYINKATALLRLGKLKEAVEHLRKAAALDPGNYRAYYNLGLVLRRLKRFEESAEVYREAVALKPDSKKAWLNLGYVYAFLGQNDNARDAFNKALEIDPAYESARRALASLEAGQIEP